ncbi:MAG: metal-dependent transcriptional regulator [Methanoregula sp.]
MAQEHVEEYLEAIYDIAGSSGTAKTNAIAKCLKVAPASVTEELQSLSEKNLIHYEPYRGASLTETGRVIAEKIKRRHRLLEVFLTDVLKIRRENVHDEACRMEHAISAETERALCKMLEAPSHCPHGSPISPCDKGITHCAACRTEAETATAPVLQDAVSPTANTTTLDTIKPPARCRIVAVPPRGPFRQRLLAMGITPGTEIHVIRTAPMGDPVEYMIRGYHLSLRKDEARFITVKSDQV